MTPRVTVTTSGPGLRVELHDGFVVDTDRSRLDLSIVHQWLSTDAFWALGRSFGAVSQAAEASINFGVYSADGVTFDWLCDVYISRNVSGRGLGRH